VGTTAATILSVHGVTALVFALAEWDVPGWVDWILFPISHAPFQAPVFASGFTFIACNELLFSLYLATAALIAWGVLRARPRGR
jgi:hypothetical protein